MEKAEITFKKCILDSQDYGSDDQHMVSRIFFELQTPKGDILDLYVNIKQTVGSDFETCPLEVSSPDLPEGIKIDFMAFRNEAERYYRGCVGESGKAFNIQGGVRVRMRNCKIDSIETCEVDISEHPKAW
jgi:hypothetical protein